MSQEGLEVCVKAEPAGEAEASAGGVSDAATREGLYADHKIKGELVLGPEVLQPPDMVYDHRDGKVTVKMEQVTDLPPLDSAAPRLSELALSVSARARQQLAMSCSVSLERLTEHYICDKTFSSYSKTRHKRLHTGNAKLFSCEICDSSFTRKYYLVRHLDIHTGRRPFICEVCSKAFANSYNLMRHNLIHTGGKLDRIHGEPFSCEVCNKQFGFKCNLVVHKRIHTGEKPFSCEHCQKRFIAKKDLIRHLRTHTGEKLYTCGECKRPFPRTDSLRKHYIRKHTERTE